MKQGETKRLKPKDKHLSASWKKRDEGRKGKQEHCAALPKCENAECEAFGAPIPHGTYEEFQS